MLFDSLHPKSLFCLAIKLFLFLYQNGLQTVRFIGLLRQPPVIVLTFCRRRRIQFTTSKLLDYESNCPCFAQRSRSKTCRDFHLNSRVFKFWNFLDLLEAISSYQHSLGAGPNQKRVFYRI